MKPTKKVIEQLIHGYIFEHYGEAEANDPCYDIKGLAESLHQSISSFFTRKTLELK